MSLAEQSFSFAALHALYSSGEATPVDVVKEVVRRIETYDDPAVWIDRLSLETLLAHAERVMKKGVASQPLYGLPFAIKDNLDLAGTPTTAGCPEFADTPAESAFVVDLLLAVGAIPIGKTNLDQFATGLVGVRSPYGIPRNPYHPEMIPGGSSSGSAVAVAAGLVSFSLGTDTAGSGRVPASFNHLVGLKPTRGWFSTRGLVPACRSLDCVSVFTREVSEAVAVAQVMGTFDVADPFARRPPARGGVSGGGASPGGRFRFGVPPPEQLEWFGDSANLPLFDAARRRLEALGGTAVPVDFAPFAEAARLLYEGPWVAERWSAIRAFHATSAEAIHPVTRKIIEGGAEPRAFEAFEADYRRQTLLRAVEAVWEQIDTLVLPTAATVYTRAEVEADPITLNSRLGTYTNFANLLDTAALAIPVGFRPDGMPFGLTLFGPAWSDLRLAQIGARFHSDD